MNITSLCVAVTLPSFSLLLPLLSVVPRSLPHLSEVQLIVILTGAVPESRPDGIMEAVVCNVTELD